MSEFVTVDSFTSPWDAHVVRGLLESEGIPCRLAGEHHVWMNWPFSLALGGVRLQVSASHAGQARAVLKRAKEGEYEAALREQFAVDETVCPQCGSKDFKMVRSSNSRLLSVVLMMLTNAPFPPKIRGVRCKHCGYELIDSR